MEDNVKKETPDDSFNEYETTEEIIGLDKVVIKMEELHHTIDIKDDFVMEAESTIEDPLSCKDCETTRKYFNSSKIHAGKKSYILETCLHKQLEPPVLLKETLQDSYTNKKEKPKKRKRTKNTSTEQYEIYIKYLEDDFNFRTGIVNASLGDNYVRTKWSKLANVLNGMGDGPNLTLEEWKKRFSDWKYATRSKYRRLVQSQKKKFCVSSESNLTPLERRALAIWKVTTGKPSVPDYDVTKTNAEGVPLEVSPASLLPEDAQHNKYRKLLLSPKRVVKVSLHSNSSPLKERALPVCNKVTTGTPTEVKSPTLSLPILPANVPQEVVPVCSQEDPSSTSTDCFSSVKTVTTSSTMTENMIEEATETLQEKEKQTKCLEGILGQLRKQNKLFSTFLKLQFPQYEEEND